MRDDFNKLMVERERLGHNMKFADVRNAKGNASFDEDAVGGKESIHRRRRETFVSRKRFNENLNPLKNFLRVNVGKPWDKVYSEICATFDKRKVINNHILEHLFQYVKLEVYIINGKPHELNKYRYRKDEGQYDLIEWRSHHYPTYYVDPRDGLLKAPKQGKTKRERQAETDREIRAEQNKVYRRIDDDNHLFLLNGIWWHYTAKTKPPAVAEYHQTPEWTMAQTGSHSPYMLSAMWKALPQAEKEKHGKKVMVDPNLRDKIEAPSVRGFNSYWGRGSTILPANKYFFKRQAANHKQLKQFGLVGTAPHDDSITMSHRERSKYKSKGVV